MYGGNLLYRESELGAACKKWGFVRLGYRLPLFYGYGLLYPGVGVFYVGTVD